MGFLRQEYWSGLTFPSLVDHVLSKLSTMTRLSWVVLHGIIHSFIELCKPLHQDKAVIHHSFLLPHNIPCMHVPHFVYPFINWWISALFHLLADMNNATINSFVQVSVMMYVIISYEYIARSWIARSYRSSVFNLLINCHTVFQNIILHSHQECKKILVLHILSNTFIWLWPP